MTPFSHTEQTSQPKRIIGKEHGIQLPHVKERTPEEKEVDKRNIQAYRRLTTAMTSRITSVHEEWKQRHGYEGVSWDEILKRPELDEGNIKLAPGVLEFETKWQPGSIFEGQEFKIESIAAPGGFEPTFWGESITESVSNAPIEEQYASPLKSLSLSTRKAGKVEQWHVHFLPDSPPLAVNKTDAHYVGSLYQDPRVIPLIKKTFGEEAVPLLSESEMEMLVIAILNTSANVGQ